MSEIKKQDEMAASAIAEADVLLLITGAGFSADSGLAVYNDVGKIEAYQLKNLDYCDVAQPKWIEQDPALFYGFYGQSFNDYRNTKPHDGFKIIQRWRDDLNRKTVASQIRSKIQHKYKLQRPFDDDDTRMLTTYRVDHENPSLIAGAFHAYTSNVDAHHYDFFGAHEIHDCHGNIEMWQCSNRDCDSGIWRAPMDHRFVVDKEWMLAPEQIEPNTKDSSSEEKKDEGDDGGPSKLGQTKTSGKREFPLQYLPPGLDKKGWKDMGPNGNWAKCGHCGSLARPAILMFGDFGFKYDVAQYKRWELWMEAVMDLVERKSEKEGTKMKVCILEIGCGMNVPTCRNLSETTVEKVVSRGGDPTLIRINPDFPEASKDSIAENHIISIPSRGLAAIRRIDEVYRTLNH